MNKKMKESGTAEVPNEYWRKKQEPLLTIEFSAEDFED